MIEKNYPNIYSLSTLGIIHHYNCDYLFHHLRTDFTGESGSGKSMIGDFLQLIFVGSKFVSSTVSLQGEMKREIKGMVYSKGKKTFNAYIFLNIEVSPRKFLVIGVSINSSNNQVKHFFIQKNYEKDTPQFLDKPLLHKNLLFENKIPNLENLNKLFGENHQCFEYRIDIFLKRLYTLKIIPYNLETEEKRNNFSIILRAFARGKGLKTDKSDSLIRFLFDDNAEKEIAKFWRENVEKIEKEVKNYHKTQEEIDIITGNADKIKKLIQYSEDFSKSKLKYLKSKCFDCCDKIENTQKQLETAKIEFTKLMIKQHFLVKSILEQEQNQKKNEIKEIVKKKGELKTIETELKTLNEIDAKKKLENIKQDLDKLSKPYSNIVEIKTYLKIKDIESLEIHHDKQKEIEKKKEFLTTFLEDLETKNLQSSFKYSLFAKDYQKANDLYKKTLDNYTKEIYFLETIQKFSNPNDKNSLANWAIDRIKVSKKPFTKEEESLLVYLQSLPREKEDIENENGIRRYLNSPEELFDNLITEEQNDGFWISLKGIKEFVSYYSEEQILNTTNVEEINRFFVENYKKAEKSLNRLNKKKEKRELLFKYVQNYQNKEVFDIYPNRKGIENFEIIEGLTSDFGQKLQDYTNKDEIEKNHADYITQQSMYKNIENEIEKLSQKKRELEEAISKKNEENIKTEIESLTIKINKRQTKLQSYEKKEPLFKRIHIEFTEKINGNLYALQGSNEEKSTTKSKETLNIHRQLRETKKEYEEAKISYLTETGNDFMPNNQNKTLKQTVQECEDEFNKAKSEHEIFYQNNILTLIPESKKSIFQNRNDIELIANEILPTFYSRQKNSVNSNIIDQVNTFLEEILRDNAEINKRHINILFQAFEKTYIKYSDYVKSYNKIKSFFSNSDINQITGGNKVVLRLIENTTDFPKKFLTECRKNLNYEFSNNGIFEALKEKSINEFIEETYRKITGKSKVPKIEELLNPKNYFTLDFKMTSEKGVSNIGSTGQTTTALALLCIARLSELETNQNKGVRFMPLDEALDLGSNFDTLYNISKAKKYQIISMSIFPLENMQDNMQYWYMLNENPNKEEKINYPPFAIFTNAEGVIEKISEKIEDLINE